MVSTMVYDIYILNCELKICHVRIDAEIIDKCSHSVYILRRTGIFSNTEYQQQFIQ